MSRKPCAFCCRSDQKISKEHAWPNWTRRLFPDGLSTILSGQPGTALRRWLARDDMGVKVNDICKGCNEGWMNDLETAVQPFLAPMIRDGSSTNLTGQQQTLTSAWCYRMALVFELARPSAEGKYFSEADRKRLMEARQPPTGGVAVSLACYAGDILSTAYNHWLSYELENDPSQGTFKGYCTTITIGQLAFQVFNFRLPAHLSLGAFPIRNGQWADLTINIWPSTTAQVTWPPSGKLDRDGLASFRGRFDMQAETGAKPFP